MINNSTIVSQFLPGQPLGPDSNEDHFLYTELLDRTKRVGNNGVRIVKTFYHRSLSDFKTHLPQIIHLCDALGVRAYTRLAPRSFKAVGKLFATSTMEAVVSENWAGMKSLYSSACGKVTPTRKLWLWDVDKRSVETAQFEIWLRDHQLLKAVVPSKKGCHFISAPFDLRKWRVVQSPAALSLIGVPDMSLHKDNATNLYIPDDAA